MLGLRYNFFGKRKKLPIEPEHTTGTPKVVPVDTTVSVVKTRALPPQVTPSMSTTTPTKVRSPTMKFPIGPLNDGHTNGVHTPPQSPSPNTYSKGSLNSIGNSPRSRPVSGNYGSMNQVLHRSTNGYKIGFVQETAFSLKRRSMSELGAGVYQAINDASFITYLEWIRSERLTTLPHKGSRWDRVLIRALYFAEQLHNFHIAIQSFALDSSVAAGLGYGHAQLLLELGYENSEALDKAFTVFYRFALSFSSLLHRSELLVATPDIREQLCLIYTDLLSLVVDVAIRFYKSVNGMTSSSASLDIFEVFGDTISSLRSRQHRVIESIWAYEIENEDLDNAEAVEIKALSRWLAPQDRVIATLSRDHTTFSDSQAEFTCLWFQKPLTRFIQSNNTVFLITGQPGSGKTVLAGSIVERLQRPVGRKSFDTISCFISSSIPTQASSLAVVRTLLYRLLDLRVGNMGMFHALDRAYLASRTSADAVSYEGHLWKALAETLKRPLEEGNDLVIVVDGLDEVTGSQNAPSEVFERLSTICQEGKRVKLIAFSSSLSFPQSSHVTHQKIAPDDVREDLHAVALKALIHNRYFHGKSGPEQENVLDQVVRTANGSFLWTILACELLYLANSNEVMTKTLSNFESSHPAVEELVLRLTTSLDLQDNAKAVLSWILAAERPFTVDEINTLSSIDVPRGVISDKGIDTLSAFKSLNPLLAVHDRIVRFRHHTIQVSLRKVIQQGKLTVPIKERETDVLLRLLTYIKSVLKERGEPSIDPADLSDRIFHRHPFLEYAVRYWVSHLQQSPLAPKSSKEFKASSDLQKAFPDTTLLPILEHVCWDSQLAAPQALDWYNLVATVRRNILTENHPAVLQTYLNIASRYTTIAKVTESRDWYYLSTKISRTVLSDIHPLTLECASRFLQLTQGTTSGTRTDIATHREEILVILITAYERQYGSTSDQVIQARRLLLDLYVSIQEHDRATELFRLIQDATIEHYGKQSKEVRDLQEHLGVSLDKRKDFHNLDGYEDAFFDDRNDDTDYETDHFDIDSVSVYLRTAEKYLSQGQVGFAERVYVELWQEVSSKCRSVRDVRWHEQHIDVAEAYTRFLEEQKRSTEASAVLTCIWQHYEHHELSFAQTILSRLVGVAKLMKTLGNYTMALSIFQFASSHFRNSRKEESSLSREVTQEVASTSTELVKQSLASSTTATETTTTVSETVFQDVFHSVISSSKNVDSATMALAKKLTVQYMEKRNWSAAVNVIKATLERTWHSFNAGSIHDVTMTSTFTNESIELVERLVECYLQLKQVDRVEEIYVRLFRAALGTSNSDKAIFAKAKTLLIGFYDKYGYVDNAIGVFQELLILHRKSLGPTHELTIQTLYTLASRCRAHPRNHPYWLEYYQQIVSSLNKDPDLCHKDAMDAIIIVATSYWEDRRYAEAVTVFRVLWNTFVRKRKEFNQLVEVDFVQRLYERYFQCLEETKTSWETMYKVTKEFHEVTASAFGADSTISAEATLALAEVAHRSEEHVAEAISLYEHASKSSKVTTTRISHIKQALSSLYIYQLQSQSASSIKAETVERAISMRSEQYAEAARKYGYTHETTLAHLRELAILYNRQQKTDVLLKQLTTATVEIITNETSSQKMIEAATSIATTFEACQQVQRRSELIQELHRQIIAKDTRHSSKWSFDLTKCRQSTLAFLAALEYSSRQDLSITLSEMMADITAEWIYYENFRRVLTGKESMKNTLFSAAPLRWFLLRRQQTGLATGVEDEVVKTFMKRDASDLHVLSKSSPRIFIVTILDYLGSGKSKNFNRCVIKASNDKVASLTKAKKFAEAYDIGNLGFLFATNHDGYNGPNSMGMGFKLASLLVGRDSEKCPDADLRKKLLELSNRIVKKIIDICKQLQVNFARVQLLELSELSALLGEQQDYATLEWLLSTLWSTRDAQRSWPAQVLVHLGRRLVCARYLAGHPIKAIRLCEDIAYNLRRTHGPRSPATIETYELLAELYTSTGQSYQAKASSEKTGPLATQYFKKALAVHEDLLRLLVRDEGDADSDDEEDTTAALLAEHGVSVNGASVDGREGDDLEQSSINRSELSIRHLHLLKFAYQRLGGWPKDAREYERLNAELFRVFGGEKEWKGAQGVEKWSVKEYGLGKAESKDGAFEGVMDWAFAQSGAVEANGKKA